MTNDLYKMRILRIIKKGGKRKFREVWKIMGGYKRMAEALIIHIHIVPCHRGDLDKRTAKSIFTAAGQDTSRLI